jgi:hypothetical protein
MAKKRKVVHVPVQEDDAGMYIDEVDEDRAPARIEFRDQTDAQVWAGFFSSVVCGAAAGSAGELVNVRLCALEADAMFAEYEKRLMPDVEDVR